MALKNKKIFVYFVLFFYSVNALAVIPILAGVAAYAGYAAGSSAIAASALTAEAAVWGSIAVHAGIFSVVFDKSGEPVSSANNAPLRVDLAPNLPLSVPAGWSASTNGSQQPVPPSIVSLTTRYQVSSSYDFEYSATTQDGACQILGNLITPQGGTFNISYNASANKCQGSYYNAGGSLAGTVDSFVYTHNVCPIGYGPSVGSCAILNAQIVMKPVDEKCTLIRTGNTIVPDSRDPDCSSSELLAKGLDLSDPSNIKITGSNGATVTTVKINSDGTAKITSKKPLANGNTSETIIDVSAPLPSGAVGVIGKTVKEYEGQGTQQSPTPIGSNGTTTVEFDKTGLATTAGQTTQASKTDITNQKLDELKAGQCGGLNQPKCEAKIDETGVSSVISDLENSKQSKLNEVDSWFASLVQLGESTTAGVGDGYETPIIGLIPTGGSCQNPVFDANDIVAGAFSELKLCEHAADIQPLLQWIAYAFTVFACWGLLFTKVGGT